MDVLECSWVSVAWSWASNEEPGEECYPRVVCPFVVSASNFRSDFETNVEVLGIILEGFGSCVDGFFVDFVSIFFSLLHRFLVCGAL